ncbi:MAG: DUF1573 domain-containing protein [Bacteroidia bacterium]|nr:DUF1573 domain-containing protein [Bacteroidia bacterium]MCO5253403.1 DUF1573 domain-containing protein [Bacteroidota bacterium]
MKKILLIACVAAVVSYGCGNSEKSGVTTDVIKDNATADNPNGASQGMPEITFNVYDHDFGTITEGEVVETTFKFKNNGTANLLISDAKGDCGCTVPVFPKEPIKPGQESKITVSFNSSGKVGENTKRVTVTTNSKEANAYLTIKATVLPKSK